jgi:hypothetical protein
MTRVRNLALTTLAGVLAVCLGGCGRGPKYVQVSGVVTLNSKPHRNAVVTFLPIGTADNPTPGRGSTGATDENGHFTLKAVDAHEGAAVGKQQVRIVTRYSAKLKGYEVWDPVGKKMVRAEADPIPPEWNSQSTKEFTVPPGGTDQANFDIVTTKAR